MRTRFSSLQVVDDALLLAVHPAGEGGDQEAKAGRVGLHPGILGGLGLTVVDRPPVCPRRLARSGITPEFSPGAQVALIGLANSLSDISDENGLHSWDIEKALNSLSVTATAQFPATKRAQ